MSHFMFKFDESSKPTDPQITINLKHKKHEEHYIIIQFLRTQIFKPGKKKNTNQVLINKKNTLYLGTTQGKNQYSNIFKV